MREPECDGYRFGPFRLNRSELLLLCEGQRVALPRKALELLLLLVAHAGQTLSRRELMGALWPDLAVHENSLPVAVSALRRALSLHAFGAGYVETVPRRGYRFAGDVQRVSARAGEAPSPVPRPTASAPAHRSSEVFVGRADELQQLLGLFELTCDSHGQIAWISGEAGMGKSALIRRFLGTLAQQGHSARVATGRCLELRGASEAYWPFLEALAGLLGGAHGASLEAELEVRAPGWCAQFPELFADGRTRPAPLVESAEVLQRQLVQALVAWSSAQPVVIVLEDLQWADPCSLELLRLWSELCRGQRLLLLGSFRPEASALDGHGMPTLRLAPLTPADLVAYLDACFPRHAFPASLAELVLRETSGLPLFAMGWIQSLREQGHVRLRAGRSVLDCELSELERAAPGNLLSLLRQRLARLSTTSQQMLAFASVEGDVFRTSVLAEALAKSLPEVERTLAELVQSCALIAPAGEELFPDGVSSTRYRFSHVAFQKLLYDALSSQRRLALHRRAAQTLEAHGCAHQGRFLAELALHHERGKSFSRALALLIDAGDRAARLLAQREAQSYYARARALVPKLPEGERRSCSLLLAHRQGWAEYRLGSIPAALAHFEALSEGARQHAAESLRAEGMLCQCQVLGDAKRWDELGERARELHALALQSSHGPHRADALGYLAAAALGNADLSSARSRLDECIALARAQRHERALLATLPQRAWIHAHQGELRAAEALYRELLEHARGGRVTMECTSALAPRERAHEIVLQLAPHLRDPSHHGPRHSAAHEQLRGW